MPRNARGSPFQYSRSVRPSTADDLDAGQVVGGLEPRSHHEHVDLALYAVDIDHAGAQ